MRKSLAVIALLVAVTLFGYVLVEVRSSTIVSQDATEETASDANGVVVSDDGKTLQVNSVVLPKVEKENSDLIVKKKLKNLNVDLSRTLVIEGPISMDQTSVALAIKVLNGRSETAPIYIVLTSPGGSVVAGAEIINAITQSKAPIYTVCRIFCASMASMIHQYGKKRYMTDRSLIMFHPATTAAEGKVNEISNYIRSTKDFVTKIEVEVATSLGLSIDAYQAKVNNEWWLDSDEALQAKVIDSIVSLELNPEVFGDSGNGEEMKKNQGISKGRKLIWIYEGQY